MNFNNKNINLESYSLLVKVAESLAQSLVAKIFVIAFEEIAEKLRKTTTSKEDNNDEKKEKQQKLQFINNEDLFTIIESQQLIINANYLGKICHKIEWYFNGEKIKSKE